MEWLEEQRSICTDELRRLSKKDNRRSSLNERFALLTREINKRSNA